MSISDKLSRLAQVKENQKTILATMGQTPSDDWETYPDLIRSASENYQATKTVDADPEGMAITPDSPYEGMLETIIKGEPNFKPWNIVSGIDVWGLTGTAKPKTSSDFPTNLPVTEEDFDGEVLDDDPEASIEDKFVLVDNLGNITTGYMYSNEWADYNGTALPVLPNVDETQFPYFVIAGPWYFDEKRRFDVYYGSSAFIVSEVSESGFGFVNQGTYKGYKCTFGVPYWQYDFQGSAGVNGMNGKIVFANHNLYMQDGTLVHSASSPVPYQGTVYNGVALPDIPVYSDTPRMILLNTDVYGEPVVYYGGNGSFDCDGERVNISGWDYHSALQNGAWTSKDYVRGAGYTISVSDIVWSNFDIVDGNSAVVFSGSDPYASAGFTITYYDPATTEFKAKGWRRVSYHTTGEHAGTYTTDDFTTQESDGWNYLKNIRMCTREKLYYNGVEVWPNGKTLAGYLYGETYEGEFHFLKTPYHAALPSEDEWDRNEYPYAVLYYVCLSFHILRISKEPWRGTGEPYMYDGEQFGETVQNTSAGLWFLEEETGDIAPNGCQKKIWTLTDGEDLIYTQLGQNKDTDGDGKYNYGAQGLINWTNHDIISADGKTVLVSASDPIPVYQ